MVRTSSAPTCNKPIARITPGMGCPLLRVSPFRADPANASNVRRNCAKRTYTYGCSISGIAAVHGFAEGLGAATTSTSAKRQRITQGQAGKCCLARKE